MSTIDGVNLLNTNSMVNNTSTSSLESKLNANLKDSTNEELMEVCKEYESYFTEQVFKQLQKMVPESEETSSSTSNLMDYCKDGLVQEYASMSSEGETIGLAQTLYEQMKRNYNL